MFLPRPQRFLVLILSLKKSLPAGELFTVLQHFPILVFPGSREAAAGRGAGTPSPFPPAPRDILRFLARNNPSNKTCSGQGDKPQANSRARRESHSAVLPWKLAQKDLFPHPGPAGRAAPPPKHAACDCARSVDARTLGCRQCDKATYRRRILRENLPACDRRARMFPA